MVDANKPCETPTVDTWRDGKNVSLVIRKPSIIEYRRKGADEGELTPGLNLSPLAALKLARDLTEYAIEAIDAIEREQGQENDE